MKVLKKILTCWNAMAPFMAIMPANSNKIRSEGLQLHIKTKESSGQKSCIERIIAENNLSLAKEEDLLVVYKAKKT